MRAQAGFTPHIRTIGAGDHSVLALHCTMASGAAWHGLAACLPELALTAPDMPSHGRSPDWDGASSFGDTVLSAAQAAMGARKMDVIGHSFGAMTALRLASQAPEQLRSLTLIEPVFFAVALADAPETLPDHQAAARPFMDALAEGDMDRAACLFNQMWSTGGPPWDSLPDRTRAAMARGVRVVPDTYALLNEDSAGLLQTPGVAQIECPTLLLRGALSDATMAAVIDGLEARMPRARQAVIEGSGHMAPISHPQAVAPLIRTFFADSETRDSST